jgi:hypothetical protein
MRQLALLSLFLLATLPPAFAARQLTVAQFEQLLSEEQDKSDAKIAHQLADLKLTERVSAARLARWKSDFPGSRTREALTLLADASSFLDLPAADLPDPVPPDQQAQNDMLVRTINYAVRTIPVLPDFMATRSTTHFEDTPLRQLFDEDTVYRPLHATGRSSVPVIYRDGHEVEDIPATKARKHDTDIGLTTSGEFGPILSVVLGDAFRNQMAWSHWEQGSAGQTAVFRYQVPLEHSHYLVKFPRGPDVVRVYPAYRGEITIDPATGNVLRLTAISDLAPPSQNIYVAILVEYAPVVIGDRTYICPVKGVALSKMPLFEGDPATPSPLKIRLNDVVFTRYHRFRADARIISSN